MHWLQLSLAVGTPQAPLIELLFEELGALSVTLGDAGDEPILEPGPEDTPLWSRVRVTALFPGDANVDVLRAAIGQALGRDVGSAVHIERLADQAWERAWLEHFRPMRFGSRLWVCPSGQSVSAPDSVVLTLDPGLAFGTGTHPTTALCLEWLDRQVIENLEVVDFGCGSGILAVAAAKLGAARVVAIDHDPQALQATEENAARNGVADRLTIDDPSSVAEVTADLLVANILASPLVELEPVVAKMLKTGGALALSGILESQTDAVAEAYRGHFDLNRPVTREEWVLLEGRKH